MLIVKGALEKKKAQSKRKNCFEAVKSNKPVTGSTRDYQLRLTDFQLGRFLILFYLFE